jgi:ABC-2 type transport system ATP-binding protein
MDSSVIKTERLTRFFGDKCAVDQVSFAVPRGSVFALLGRNGSGKTTLVRMLLGMLNPTRGSGKILGDDIRDISPATRGRIGYIAEGHPLIDWMRVKDLESYQKSFFQNWDDRLFKTVVDHFGLSLTAQAKELSRGQRAGLSLALSLSARPELLVMDDPALGLDPVARRTLLEAMILVTRDAGHTILFTSHELADVERVADHIGIMDLSVLRVCCSLDTFRERVKKVRLTFAGDAPRSPKIPGLLDCLRQRSTLQLLIADVGNSIEPVIAGLSPLSVEYLPVSLEEAVVAYLRDRQSSSSLLNEPSFAGASL